MRNFKPFNLKEALSGKAVVLQNGAKAYVRHLETELAVANYWQLLGYKENGDLIAWDLDGSNSFRFAGEEIIGMWPETRVVNGFEVPVAETQAPPVDSEYFVSSIGHRGFHMNYLWDGSTYDFSMLERGIVFLNKGDAIATAKAMLGIDPYSDEAEA